MFIVLVNPAVSNTGAVSPTPRATPRMTAVVRPERAVGNTICQTVLHCGAPSAAEASRKLPGTRRNTTSAERMMMGSIMMLIAIEAASPERGNPRISTHVAKMNNPARIDGSAVIAVTTVRTNPVARLLVSFKYTAHATPSGTVRTSEIAVMISVPAMAWVIPPTFSGSLGPVTLRSWVKKFECTKAVRPRHNTKMMTEARAPPASTEADVSSAAITRSTTAGRSSVSDKSAA